MRQREQDTRRITEMWFSTGRSHENLVNWASCALSALCNIDEVLKLSLKEQTYF